MDPSNKTTPPIETSPPVFQENEQGELVPLAPERPVAAPERAPVPKAPSAAAIPLPSPTPAAPAGDVTVTTSAATPMVDDDDDQIEKVWVEKAKQIVEQTRNDPHKQSQELTVFKADYMKKRYGKTIKVS